MRADSRLQTPGRHLWCVCVGFLVAVTHGTAASHAQCCDAAWRLIEETIRGAHTVESIAGLLAGSVPAQLASVLASVCAELQGQWKVDAIKSTVAVPRLVGVDWRVDVKTASSHAAGMGIPAVIMQLKVEGDRVVTMEMDKETLQAMLSGLGKIRDQLNRIA